MDYKEKYEQGLECIQEILSSGEEKIKMTLLKERLQPFFPELESEDERIRKWLLDTITQIPNDSIEWDVIEKAKVLAWLEKQSKRDARYENLEELLEADTIYQMSMNDAMVKNAKTKAMNALSELEIGKLFGIEKQGGKKPAWSEEDEKIRKVLIDYFNRYKEQEECGVKTFYGIPTDKILAWLEKQGEQKPTDKVEPKFHEGDWIIDKESKEVFYLSKTLANTCKIVDIEGNDYHVPHYTLEEDYDVWTIQDAKDGDVLYSLDSNQPFIYKERKLNEQATAYCGLNIYGKCFVWGTKDCVITLNNCVPATKEQRDLLFKKIEETGYQWDAEKKELKIIDWSKHIKYEPNSPSIIEQKPTWSDEDEEYMSDVIAFLKDARDCRQNALDCIEWMKQLKERLS